MLDEGCQDSVDSSYCTCFVANHRSFFDDCLLERSAPAVRLVTKPIFLEGDQCEARGFQPLQRDHGACFGGSGSKFGFYVSNEREFWQNLGLEEHECRFWAEGNGQCVDQYDGNRYDDDRYDDNRYDDNRYDDNRYDDNRYDEDRYDRDRYDEDRYDRNRHGDSRYDRNRNDDNRYDDNRYEENRYEDNRHEDNQHGEIQV